VKWLFDRWTMSVWHHAHGLLIPPVVAYFVYRELRPLRALPPAASAWGLAIVLPALALHAIDTGMHTQLLSAISLVLCLPGLSLLLLGPVRTRAILFPLAFMALALPIPLSVTEQLHLVLRYCATFGASQVLPYLGVPVFAEGTTLHMGTATLEIADACSGFSTLYAAIAVASLTAYTTDNNRRRLAVLALAAPIAVAANLVRVVLLAFLVVWFGVDVLATSVHTLSGVFTFVLALPVLFWIGQPDSTTGAIR